MLSKLHEGSAVWSRVNMFIMVAIVLPMLIVVVIMVVTAGNEAQVSEEREQSNGSFHGIEAMVPYLTVNHHVSVIF